MFLYVDLFACAHTMLCLPFCLLAGSRADKRTADGLFCPIDLYVDFAVRALGASGTFFRSVESLLNSMANSFYSARFECMH